MAKGRGWLGLRPVCPFAEMRRGAWPSRVRLRAGVPPGALRERPAPQRSSLSLSLYSAVLADALQRRRELLGCEEALGSRVDESSGLLQTRVCIWKQGNRLDTPGSNVDQRG